MGISPKTVRYLRAAGHDVVHLADEGLHRLPDPEIVVKARRESRVILTVDLDFADLLALAQERYPSAIIFRLARATPQGINAALDRCLQRLVDELRRGAVLSVSETTVRVRLLPIDPSAR
jgi:predicted nuclease of predicted toxin-antitoxin system